MSTVFFVLVVVPAKAGIQGGEIRSIGAGPPLARGRRIGGRHGDFRALVLHEEGGNIVPRFERVEEERLPEGEVTVAVEYSTLNYKDAMVLQGLGRLVRSYPHIPGIDFAGTVERSDAPEFQPGDPVILTGWRVGETHWGGYAEKARVQAAWLVRRPEGLGAAQAMAIGTAGLTAMLALMALERHGLRPGEGEVLVTGAAGGVGSVAVALLSALGHRVVAATGRPEQRDYLTGLGAADLIERASPRRERRRGRSTASAGPARSTPSAAPPWRRSSTQLKYRASVAACGLAGGSDLPATVIPFLLRGVNLLGIDSVMCPREERIEAWRRLAARSAARAPRTDHANRAALRLAGTRAAAAEGRGARPHGCRSRSGGRAGILSMFARWRSMMRNPAEAAARTPAQRGQIVQRVIVDGWTCAEAAAAAGLPEQLVDAWVSAFRQHGMASLRHAARNPVAGALVHLRLRKPARSVWAVLSSGLGRWFLPERSTGPASLRHSQDDRRGGS